MFELATSAITSPSVEVRHQLRRPLAGELAVSEPRVQGGGACGSCGLGGASDVM
jgi:hypothetical protein